MLVFVGYRELTFISCFSLSVLFIVGCLELKSIGLLMEVVDFHMEMFGFVGSWWI